MARLRDSRHLSLSTATLSGNPTRLLHPETVSAVNGGRDETFRRGFDALKDVHVALALRRARSWCRGFRSPRPPSGPSPTRALPLSPHRLPPAPSRSHYRRLGYVSEHHSSNHGCDGRA